MAIHPRTWVYFEILHCFYELRLFLTHQLLNFPARIQLSLTWMYFGLLVGRFKHIFDFLFVFLSFFAGTIVLLIHVISVFSLIFLFIHTFVYLISNCFANNPLLLCFQLEQYLFQVLSLAAFRMKVQGMGFDFVVRLHALASWFEMAGFTLIVADNV